MSHVLLSPSSLCGEITVPPSKSAAHRAILCAALSRGICHIHNVAQSNDISVTMEGIRALGAQAELSGSTLTIDACGLFSRPEAEIDCGESGSSLRFFIPVAAAGGVSARFTGHGRLPQRPIGIYLDCLPPAGVSCRTEGGLPLTIQGQLRPGVFSLPGDISSQFVTGLLLALPLLKGDSRIVLTSPLESAGYVDMTLEMMGQFGVQVKRETDGYTVPGNQRYLPCDCTVEGDWSQAAFFLAAGALGKDPLTIHGLSLSSTQGDREAADLFRRFGAEVTETTSGVTVIPHSLHGIDIDAAQIPDLVPILAAVGALAEGVTRITGAGRLRIKESDRLTAIADGIRRLGGKAEELPDGLILTGVPKLSGGKAEGYNDHRIVMALSIAALRSQAPVELTDAQSIRKSYPNFFDDYNRLGGQAHVI